MKSRLVFLASCLLALGACDRTVGGPELDEGMLELPLLTTSSTDTAYRLSGATFSIDGPIPTSDPPRTVFTDDFAPDDVALSVDLPEGDYIVSLLDGWLMERYRSDTGVWETVEATALDRDVSVTIAAGEVSQVLFRFEVPEGTLSFGVGQIVIEVDENGECPQGFTHCGVGCVDLMVTLTHCGDCGMACGFPHASASCEAGACGLSICQPGFDDCDGVEATGCETNLNEDIASCGACGQACGTNELCQEGICQSLTCPAGTASCDGVAANGCEVDLDNDTANCGGCGLACLPGETCEAGACMGPVCEPGTENCDGVAANGCEVDLDNDTANCGGCGVACAADEACVNGACQAVACASGTADCDGDPANGCEVDLNNDSSNCGACGTVCGRFLFWQLRCRDGACAF